MPVRGKKKLGELIEEWKREILPNRKLGGARASLSHFRTYITPLLGEKPLHELNVREHQSFVTAVGPARSIAGRRRRTSTERSRQF
jgi:hypothetical protein